MDNCSGKKLHSKLASDFVNNAAKSDQKSSREQIEKGKNNASL